MDKFPRWYNEEHSHSGIRYVSPVERHRGEDRELLKKHDELYPSGAKSTPGMLIEEEKKRATGRSGNVESGKGKQAA